MKKINLLIVSVALILSACTKKDTYKTPETEMEKISYSLGLNMATGLKMQGLDSIDVNAFAKAFKDVFEGNDLDISEEESKTILNTFSEKLQAEKSAKANKDSAEAYREGEMGSAETADAAHKKAAKSAYREIELYNKDDREKRSKKLYGKGGKIVK